MFLIAHLRALDILLTTQDADSGPPDPLAELTGMQGSMTARPAPQDPALARLRPDAYAADEQDGAAATEFRRLTEGALEAHQRHRVAIVLDTLSGGDRITLDPDQADAWLGALNDLRLALGTRLEVTEELLDVPPEDPRAGGLQHYHLLGQLQSDLLDALGGAPF